MAAIAEENELTPQTALTRPSMSGDQATAPQTEQPGMVQKRRGGPVAVEGIRRVSRNAYGTRNGNGRYSTVVEPPDVTERRETWCQWLADQFGEDCPESFALPINETAKIIVVAEDAWLNLQKRGGFTRKGAPTKALQAGATDTQGTRYTGSQRTRQNLC